MSTVKENRMYVIDNHTVNLSGLDWYGRILDVGGGGEGVIGRLFREQVVAIDPLKEELEETMVGPLKIIMDARDLKFLDNSFDYVTVFFTMMYIQKQDHDIVLKEIYRVLKPKGRLIIWDVIIDNYVKGDKDVFVIPIKIELDKETINTGYGVKWKGSEQNSQYYINLCKDVGFKVIKEEIQNQVYCITLEKE